MGLLDDCKQYFGCDNLYEVLGVNKEATDSQIKTAYRKQSLKVHPDRADDTVDKEVAKRAFQTLSKVHYILSDKTNRQTYDETGIIPSDDSFESKDDWYDYWRLLFPKITEKDVESFMDKYIGSEDERNDLKTFYIRFEGDMDAISQSLIGFDEDRTRQLIQEMIDNEEVEEFDAFVNELDVKRSKRQNKAKKEAKMAEKASKKMKNQSDNDLVLAIRSKNENGFNSLIAGLEAKYADKDKKSTKNKTKSSKRK
ncbi:dnaJ homolog subfamily C member 9-like [Oppia nitens]|uniref:dnaJ homolog subfamily C member 9-like n=1 Tax=Oppia nitens TaxID=1686743 RepID=UPI0023DA6B39|nr:dnaJ homolog subfamily C member 9-like [Oppia nitens]